MASRSLECLNTEPRNFFHTREVSKPEPELCACECEMIERTLWSHGRRGWFKKIGVMC